jgi:hypothetical protein
LPHSRKAALRRRAPVSPDTRLALKVQNSGATNPGKKYSKTLNFLDFPVEKSKRKSVCLLIRRLGQGSLLE